GADADGERAGARADQHRAAHRRPAISEERSHQDSGERDPPEVLVDVHPVRVLERERIHRDDDEVDREREPPAAEAKPPPVHVRKERAQARAEERSELAGHAIAAADSWKSPSSGAPAPRSAL